MTKRFTAAYDAAHELTSLAGELRFRAELGDQVASDLPTLRDAVQALAEHVGALQAHVSEQRPDTAFGDVPRALAAHELSCADHSLEEAEAALDELGDDATRAATDEALAHVAQHARRATAAVRDAREYWSPTPGAVATP